AGLDVHTDCPGAAGDAVGRLLLLSALDGFFPFVQRRLPFVQSLGTVVQVRLTLVQLFRPGIPLILALLHLLLQCPVLPLQRAVVLTELIAPLFHFTQLPRQRVVLRRLRGIWSDKDTHADAGRQGQHTGDGNPSPPCVPTGSRFDRRASICSIHARLG